MRKPPRVHTPKRHGRARPAPQSAPLPPELMQTPETRQQLRELVSGNPNLQMVPVELSEAHQAWLYGVALAGVMHARRWNETEARTVLRRQKTRVMFGRSGPHFCATCDRPAGFAGVIDRPQARILVYLICDACLQNDADDTERQLLDIEREMHHPPGTAH